MHNIDNPLRKFPKGIIYYDYSVLSMFTPSFPIFPMIS
ncbi:MAG: hypothetical protein ACD_78C00159G0001, partial [uncultured bacterium (gcode 4)]